MTYTPPASTQSDATNRWLVFFYLLGLYLGVAAKLPGGIPVPAVLVGIAGALLVLKNAGRVAERHLVPIVAVLVLYLLSVLTAPNYAYLGERFKGFIQLSYSLVLGYGLYLAMTRHSRIELARVLLFFCLTILIGCALENYTGFRGISDAVRNRLFESGIYESDIRDQYLYGRIRPKLFTSEPSAVTFAYTLFAFAWYVLAHTRLKLLVYVALLTGGYWLMRGPTLLLGFALIPAYEVLLSSRRGPIGDARLDLPRATVALMLTAVLVVAALFAGSVLYAERIEDIVAGRDVSFFARVIAPLLTAIVIVGEYPLTGAGLTGWEFIEPTVQQIYTTAPTFSLDYRFGSAAHAITNYFWLHWIYLGLLWGCVLFAALTWLLRALGAPSILFCWAVWAVFGHAAGAYVDPRTWTVFMLTCAVAVLHEREARQAESRRLAKALWRWRHTQGPRPTLAIGTR
jgi:hypothetical protein